MPNLRLLGTFGVPAGLAFMAVVDATGTGAYLTVSVVFLTRSVGLSAAQVGLGLSVAAGVAMASTVPVGALADRFGPRPVLVATALWRAAGFAAYPWVRGFGDFVAVVCLMALVGKTAEPLTQAVVGQVTPDGDRVRAMAAVRVLRNVGFTLGALAGGGALLFDARWAYAAVLLGNAASFVAYALTAARLPAPVSPKESGQRALRRRVSLRALRDRPYLALAALNGALTMHMTLLAVGVPLSVGANRQVPHAVLAALLIINTVLAVACQVPASRGSATPSGAGGRLRAAGVALASCCALLAWVPSLPLIPAVAVLVAATVFLTAGELFQSAGGWGLSYELARDGEQNAYLSVFWLGVGAQQIAAPAALALAMAAGPAGWLAVGAVLAVAGAAVPAVTRRAVRGRASETAGTAPRHRLVDPCPATSPGRR